MSRVPTIVVATPPGIDACFTTRAGGVSDEPFQGLNLGVSTGDEPRNVAANRHALAASIGADPRRFVMTNQVHGTDVRAVEGPDDPERFGEARTGWSAGDGLVTEQIDVPLMVLGADCPSILIWRTDGSAVAAVHAGWRGLIGGIVQAAVGALGGPVAAAVGPCAGGCCYEVDDDLRTRFRERYGAQTVVGANVDLPAAARAALIEAGVRPDAVAGGEWCTICDPVSFFSHRRDGARSGRQAGVIRRTAA